MGGNQGRAGANHGSVAAELEQHIAIVGKCFIGHLSLSVGILRTKEQKQNTTKKEKSIFRHAASSSDSQMVLDCSHSNIYIQHLVTLISLGGNNV